MPIVSLKSNGLIDEWPDEDQVFSAPSPRDGSSIFSARHASAKRGKEIVPPASSQDRR